MGIPGFKVLPTNTAEWDRFLRNVPVKPDANSVSTEQLAVDAVATANVQDAAITTAKIANLAIDDTKLALMPATSVKTRATDTDGEPGNTAASADDLFLVRRAGQLVFDPLSDTDIPPAIARDTEVSAAITAGIAAALQSGTYTPTLTNVTNLDTSGANLCAYTRIGTIVTVSGRVDLDPTAAGDVELGISLPIASNFTNNTQCAGVAFCNSVAGLGAAILSDLTNDRASLRFVAVDTSNRLMMFIFQYQIL